MRVFIISGHKTLVQSVVATRNLSIAQAVAAAHTLSTVGPLTEQLRDTALQTLQQGGYAIIYIPASESAGHVS